MLIAPANLSTALLLGASCLMLLFIGRAKAKHILITIGIAMIPILFLVISAMVRHSSANDEESELVKSSSTGLFGRVETCMAARQLTMMKCTR